MDKPLNEAVPQSRTILGWVRGSSAGDTGFQENAGFRDLLQESIAEALLEPGFDEVLENEAIQRGDGWMNINDSRNVPALNRTADPDDIVGTVMVKEGKVVGSTYQPMPSYRLCTSDGPTRLTDGLNAKLLQKLDIEWEKESGSQLR